MDVWQAVLLGVVEGITEFLPISSTGHLTIVEKLLGYSINNAGITAFTAIVQLGAVLATVLYLRRDIIRITAAWVRGLVAPQKRTATDYRFGWAIIAGSVPIGIVGLLFKDQIETSLRSLWFIGLSLIIWSVVMWGADRAAKQYRHEQSITVKDTVMIGIAQCLALIPGVSRSGATMSAGLLRGFDRVTVTKLSFFLSIPALIAAGILQSVSKFDDVTQGVGWWPTLVAATVSFFVAYASVAWLLRFVAKHDYSVFIWYRLILGTVIIVLLLSGTISAV